MDLHDPRTPEPASWWRRPTTRTHAVALFAPFVFVVEFLLALVGYASDWVMALAIAAFITPITVGLIVLFWRPPRDLRQDE
jgi:hypothetical protein